MVLSVRRSSPGKQLNEKQDAPSFYGNYSRCFAALLVVLSSAGLFALILLTAVSEASPAGTTVPALQADYRLAAQKPLLQQLSRRDKKMALQPARFKPLPMQQLEAVCALPPEMRRPIAPQATPFGTTPASRSSQQRHYAMPVAFAQVSSGFGYRNGRLHQGVDYAAPTGTPIRAARDGNVAFSGWQEGYGQLIVLDHGQGMQTRYGHCSRLAVSSGQRVRQGAIIGFVGNTGRSTGPHLHFEVLSNGVARNPATYIQPDPILASRPKSNRHSSI